MGNSGSIVPSRVPARSVPAFRSVHGSCGTPSIRADALRRAGMTGSISAAVTRKRVGRVVQRGVEHRPALSGFFASAQGSRLTMYWLTARTSSHVSCSATVI